MRRFGQSQAPSVTFTPQLKSPSPQPRRSSEYPSKVFYQLTVAKYDSSFLRRQVTTAGFPAMTALSFRM